MANVSITVNADIAVPISWAWQCWVEPRHITNWNFASDDWWCPRVQNDLTPGGRYIARMEAKDGSMGFDFEASYDEVEPLRKIAYTMDDGRTVVTRFEADGATTRVAMVFDAEDQNPPEMQRKGWQAILDNFKKYCELKPVTA